MSDLRIALQSLNRNKIRTLLAVLGVVVGVGAVVVVMSAGEGIKGFVLGQLDAFGSDLIQVEIKVPLKGSQHSVANASAIAMGVSVTTLKNEDGEAIKKLPNVKNAYWGLMSQQLVSYGNEVKKSMLMGLSPEVADIDPAKVVEGQFYTKNDDSGLARVAVLGWGVKQRLFGDQSPVGKDIKINQMNFRVVGVMEKRGMVAFLNFDDQIFLPVRTLQKLIMGVDYVTWVSAQVENVQKANVAADDIRILLSERHKITNPDKEDFGITTMAQAREMLNTVLGGITLLLTSLALISLLVGGVGIMNVMYVSVVERTYEIGLRKAVGAKDANILRQFLSEAVLITVAGGLIGFIIGNAITFLISRVATGYGFDWKYVFSLQSLLVGGGASVLTGLIFGLYPARQAAVKSPMEALRFE